MAGFVLAIPVAMVWCYRFGMRGTSPRMTALKASALVRDKQDWAAYRWRMPRGLTY